MIKIVMMKTNNYLLIRKNQKGKQNLKKKYLLLIHFSKIIKKMIKKRYLTPHYLAQKIIMDYLLIINQIIYLEIKYLKKKKKKKIFLEIFLQIIVQIKIQNNLCLTLSKKIIKKKNRGMLN